jgi:hypothetical protein
MLPKKVLRALPLPQCQFSFPYYYDYPTPPRLEKTDYFLHMLWEPLKEHIPGDINYTHYSELFEYIKTISIFYESVKYSACSDLMNHYFPAHFFAKANYDATTQDSVYLPEILARKINRELERYGSHWQALRDGLCGGNVIRMKELMTIIAEKEKNLIKATGSIY